MQERAAAYPLVYAIEGGFSISCQRTRLARWPSKLEQTVGNCVVKNYEIRLQISWRKGEGGQEDKLYRWFREEEIRLIPLKSYGDAKTTDLLDGNAVFAKDISIIESAVEEETNSIKGDIQQVDLILHRYVFDGDEQAVIELLKQNPNINKESSKGYIPLHIAALFGRVNITNLLIEHGANIEAENKQGDSALSLAVLNNQSEIVEAIQKQQEAEDYKQQQGATDLHYAVLIGNVERIKYLLDNGADHNSVDKNNYTPSHLAAQQGKVKVIQLLLQSQYKVSISAKTTQGNTPLHLSIIHEHLDVVNCLLEARADPNQTDIKAKGKTPLQYAFDQSNIAIIKLLLQQEMIDLQAISFTHFMDHLEEVGVTQKELEDKGAIISTKQLLDAVERFLPTIFTPMILRLYHGLLQWLPKDKKFMTKEQILGNDYVKKIEQKYFHQPLNPQSTNSDNNISTARNTGSPLYSQPQDKIKTHVQSGVKVKESKEEEQIDLSFI